MMKMGRRQSVSLQLPNTSRRPEKASETGLESRIKHKPRATSLQRCNPYLSSLETSDKGLNLHQPAPCCKHNGFRGIKPAVTPPCQTLCKSVNNLQGRPSPRTRDVIQHEQDSDTDLSDSERIPVKPSICRPPKLKLKPEAISDDKGHKPTRQMSGGFDFPDFLPPPFNSWSLSQLAVLCNMHEQQGLHRARSAGPLERYLQRLLRLEQHQIQTVLEESGTWSSCQRTPAAAAAVTRLSSPKCILQCQRAFPLGFICCRGRHTTHQRQSRVSLPQRSYSESRALPSESLSVSTNNHLRRMQASGNLRTPSQGPTHRPQRTASDPKDSNRTGRSRRTRSGSQQSKDDDKKTNVMEKRRGVSEYRRAADLRTATEFKDCEIKPDAVAAILDNLAGAKGSVLF